MKEYNVRETGDNDFRVTDKDTGTEYDVHLNHYGNHTVSKVDSAGGGGLGLLIILVWIAWIFVMPVVFFTEKIYVMDSAPIFFVVTYLVVLGSFIFTFFPDVKKKKFERLKKYGFKCIYIINYLLLITSAIIYFTLGEGNSTFVFVYFMPIVSFILIGYHVKDFHLIPVMMERLKIKRYSFLLVYFLQWLIICAIFLYGILEPFGDFIGEFAAFIICYMYMIYVDIKKFILCRKAIF